MQKPSVKIVLTFLFMLLAVSVLSTVEVNGQTTTDTWPMFGHDLTHSGYSTAVAPRTNQTYWTYKTDGQVRSSVAIKDNIVYAATFGGYIYAIDANTGNKIWSYNTGNNIWSSPAIANGVVYIGSNDFKVYALEAASGTQIWSYPTGGGVFSSPSIVGDVVYVGSTDNNLYALNANTGAKIWNYSTNGQIRSSPAIVNGVVYVGSQDGYFYAIDAASGAKIWSAPTGDGDTYTNSSPTVIDGVVYVGSTDKNVYAFKTPDGTKVWSYLTRNRVSSSPAVAGGTVYVGSEDGSVYALKTTNGEKIWSTQIGSVVYSSPALAQNIVYIGSWDGTIFALDATSGEVVWKYTTGGGIFAPPAIANGAVFIGSYDSTIYALGKYSTSSTDPTTKPAPTSSPSTITALENTPWVPQPTNAAAATIVAVAATAVAALTIAASMIPAGVPTNRITKETSNLLPSTLKKWLASFVSSKRKLKVEEKTGSIFKPTKNEAIVYIIAISLLAFSFSYVKVDNLPQIWTVLPTILATSIFVAFAKTFASIAYSRYKGVWTEYKLWYFGLATFIITTFAFRVPFSSPTRSVHFSPKLTKKLGANLSLASVLMELAFAGFFLVLMLSGFKLIGSTGLAMCIIDAFFDTLPIKPMNGKTVFDHKKTLWATLFAATLSLYIAWLLLV
jgi:outer membrane protein assembly factor BamB